MKRKKPREMATVYGIFHKEKAMYIGTTIRDVRTRVSQHVQSASSRVNTTNKLYLWLRENSEFVVRPIEFCFRENRFEREKHWISYYDTVKNGLNSDESSNLEKTRERYSNTPPGRPKGCGNPSGKSHYLYGKRVSRHIVEASVAARIGKPLTDEHREKIRLGNAKRAKRVRCIETGEVFDSVDLCARTMGTAPSNLRAHLSGKTASTKGFTFVFA